MGVKTIKRTDRIEVYQCPSCKQCLSGKYFNCEFCGTHLLDGETVEIELDHKYCGNCDKAQHGSFMNYCDNCGEKLGG